MLEGLECVPMTAAELSAVAGALRYLGRDTSAAWLYGATGHAFAINIRPTVCVSSPYAWDKTLYDLAPNVGCRITGIKVSMEEAGEEFGARQREAWDMVRDAVDRGLPCYADRVSWMPDYSLITGYDDVGYYYTHSNPGARGGPTPWQKLGTEDIEVLDVWRVDLCEPKPDEDVVKAVLEEVLRRSATPYGWTASAGHRSGPAAFDLWADELELGHAKLDSHTYNAHFWWESRAMAVEFLQEVKQRLPGRADAELDEAIAHYSVVRDRLEAVKDLCPFRDNADWIETLQSQEQARLIGEAGASERKGLQALARVLVALGGTPPEPPASAEEAPPRGAGGRRFVIEGVRKVAYHTDRWRFTPFCNALDACLQYLGEPEQYDYLMCTSGAAFRMRWTPKAWDGGNSDILGMATDTLEPMRRAFRSAGYEMVPVAKGEVDDWAEELLRDATRRMGGELTDEAGFRRRIIGSIDRGFPVIAFGVIGPPEACVVTGYDERGDVLVGWNVFQDEEGVDTDAAGRFRVRDWYPKTRGLLLFGEKVGRPDQDELDRETLKWALQVLRAARVREGHAGPAAFEAWAADMLNDECFPEGQTDVLRGRLMCHWDSMTVTAFRGGGGATEYLLAAAEREPAMSGHLRAAAECIQNEDVVHGVAPGEEAQIARLADPQVRREVADSILHARDMHVEAADHIERALLAAGVPPEEIPRPVLDPADAADDPDERVVLEGVPKVGYGVIDGNVAMTPFPACLKACLEHMGDDLGFGDADGYPRDAVYAYLMGTTGAAFRLLWKPGWHGDNVATFAICDDPGEIFRRGFAAAGYEQMPSGHMPEAEKAQRFRTMVVEAIRDRGRPVIAHGVIGPPEECVIAGYDEGGRVAIGWNFFQDREIGHPGVEFEPNGMFRKRHWEADTWGMMAIGDKVEMPQRRQAYVDALGNALRIIRDPVRGDCHNGIAAYDAWAEHVLRDDQVGGAGGPDDPFYIHNDAVDVVAEGRWFASVFLSQAAQLLPEAKNELLEAAECFKAEHDLMWVVWGEVGGNVPSEETRREFLKADVRRRIVPLIHQARDRDAEAAAHIEQALLALGVPQDEIAEAPPAGATPEVAQGPSGKALLEGISFPRWLITQLGCMHGSLEYLGRDVPRPWLYGGTAHAFFINIHQDVDVEAVTAWDDAFIRELTPNLGFHVDRVRAVKPHVSEAEWRRAQMEAWGFVRRSIQLKQPCYGWELKAPYGDWWLIIGYDDAGYYYAGWETGGPTPWRRLGEQFIPVLDVRSVKLCEPAPDEVVVRDALVAAVAHAQPGWDPSADDDAHFGPDAFVAWAEALESGAALHNHHAYNAQAWHECREMAVEFLREAKRRLAGRADAPFDEAIAHYALVRDRLAAVKELTPIDDALGWDEEPKIQSAEAARLVREAGAAERQGLVVLAQIAVALGAEVPDSPARGGGEASASRNFRPVLLEDAVADFRQIADDVAGHRIELCARGADEDVYPQPYCYLTTMLVQMHAAGWDEMDLDTLAAVSGASAMFGYESGEFGPKYAFHRRDPNRLVAEATGYGTEAARGAAAEDAWKLVMESVDSGRPVSAWEGEMMLLAGYQDAGAEADRKVFAMKDGNGYYAEWWDWDRFSKWMSSQEGWPLFRHSGRVEPKPAKEVALRVMGDLVALSGGAPEDIQKAFPKATFGLAGIEAWAADCADMEKREDWGMCHPENPQWTVRNSTASYLQGVAERGLLPAEAAAHVRRASELYRSAYRSWQEAYGLVGYAAPDGSGRVKENRLAAAAAVRRAAEHEKAAIAELRLALAAEKEG